MDPITSAIVLDREQKEQQRKRWITVAGLVGGLVVALGLAGAMTWQWQQSEIAQVKILTQSSNFLLVSNKQFDALIASLRAGKLLKRIFWVEANTQTEVVSLLRKTISEVREKNRLEGHKNTVTNISFSPDGKTLASASGDRMIILWDLAINFWDFDLDNLLVHDCNWVRSYLENNPNVSKSDKHLCDGISTQ